MDNPFKLETPAAVLFSGGRTSGKMLYEILQAYDGQLPPDVQVCFENTGEETEATLVFVDEVSRRWGVPIVWLEYDDVFRIENYTKSDGTLKPRRDSWDLANPADRGFKIVDFATASRNGEPFDKMLCYYAEFRARVKGIPPILPTVPDRMCTTHLKIKVNTRYMMMLGYDYFDAALGIRFDEPKRWTKMMAQNDKGGERYTNVCPLYDAKVAKPDVWEFWGRQPFDLGLSLEAEEGNCRFCFLKAMHKIVEIMRKDIAATGGVTEQIERWVRREREGQMTFRRDRPSYEGLVQIALAGEAVTPRDEAIIDCICGT